MTKNEIQSKEPFLGHTQFIFNIYKLIGSPLEGLFYIFAFMLLKDLNASPLQITILIASKPTAALLSFYMNIFIKNKPGQLKSAIILATILGSVPCLFFPFTNNVWALIVAQGIFMLSHRAVLPAWAEILKINLCSFGRSKVFSGGSILSHSFMILTLLLVSPLLDVYPHLWRWLFFAFAALNLANVILLLNLKLKNAKSEPDPYRPYRLNSFVSTIIDPWRNGWQLIKRSADFRGYQIVFMLCGGGLMVIQPILTLFSKETLQLSYTELTLATSFCKGIAFALFSPIWASWLNRISIHLFNFFVTGLAALFIIFIIASYQILPFYYVGYLIYGTCQAGSELSWNLSGPIFAKSRDSTLFTGINVAAVGVRGCIAPFLGEFIFYQTGNPLFGFLCGGILCLSASIYSFRLYWQANEVQGIEEAIHET